MAKTVEAAHAAGRRDGAQGLGPIAPATGPPGSLAHRLHAAYMQSYRDAIVARVGIPERRRNPKRKARGRRPRGRKVRGKTVTTTTRSKVIRRSNRRDPLPALVVLYAHKPGMRRLKYLGHGKFGERGRPVMFKSAAYADLAGWILKDTHPTALRGWTLKAE
jgi:hypothetical protein